MRQGHKYFCFDNIICETGNEARMVVSGKVLYYRDPKTCKWKHVDDNIDLSFACQKENVIFLNNRTLFDVLFY